MGSTAILVKSRYSAGPSPMRPILFQEFSFRGESGYAFGTIYNNIVFIHIIVSESPEKESRIKYDKTELSFYIV